MEKIRLLLNMKLDFFYIIVLMCLFGCSNNKERNNKALIEETLKDSSICAFERSWQNEDTTIFINGDTITVKYEQNDSLGRNVVISKNKLRFEMGYDFPEECIETYRAPIPFFEWTNGNVVCLSRSCGSYCRTYIFINCNNWQQLERENILCVTENKEIIAYLQEDGKKIVIEKIFDWKKKYSLKYNIPCETVICCIDSIYFNNQKLFILYRNFQDKIIYEKFPLY